MRVFRQHGHCSYFHLYLTFRLSHFCRKIKIEKCYVLKYALRDDILLVDVERMVRVRDRTEDFKDAVRAAALSFEYSESKLAAILASFIIHKPKQRSSFTKAAVKTLERIVELEHFIENHRKDYVDLRRNTEQEKDNIEHEVSVFVKTCKDQIDILKSSIHDEEKNVNERTWLHIRADTSHLDDVAHKHGVVLILSERLLSVTSQFDRHRSTRFQVAVNRAIPRRKLPDSKSFEASNSNIAEFGEQELSTAPTRLQHQILNDETQALQVELSTILDAVQDTETRMVEMSALNHLMSTHILQQSQQIEHLYEQAVEATNNVEQGNKELVQAIQRNSSSRTFLLLFFFVLIFSILFLDWYS